MPGLLVVTIVKLLHYDDPLRLSKATHSSTSETRQRPLVINKDSTCVLRVFYVKASFGPEERRS